MSSATRQLRASAVLGELARRGVETNRESLIAVSDRLGVAVRPVTGAGGLGNRRWTRTEVDLLTAAYLLRVRHGISIDTVAELAAGRTDPQQLIDQLIETLAILRCATAA